MNHPRHGAERSNPSSEKALDALKKKQAGFFSLLDKLQTI
jgi:hypothetical protein